MELLCDLFILRKVSRKRKLVQCPTDDENKNTKKKDKTSSVYKPVSSVSEVSSLSGLLD